MPVLGLVLGLVLQFHLVALGPALQFLPVVLGLAALGLVLRFLPVALGLAALGPILLFPLVALGLVALDLMGPAPSSHRVVSLHQPPRRLDLDHIGE